MAKNSHASPLGVSSDSEESSETDGTLTCLGSRRNGPNLNASMFTREDWTLFRNLQTLGQKAGIPRDRIPQLVAKELVDNSLDAGRECVLGFLNSVTFYVEDDGPGIPGTDEDVAALFSVSRPLTSTKLLRLPTRGAMGNGLRVAAGAVLASGGQLVVCTKGRRLRLRPRDSDGGTDVERIEPWNGQGTRIELMLGPSLVLDEDVFRWADLARDMAGHGRKYVGKTSPWWYDSDTFYELLQAAGKTTVRDLAAGFDGCAGAKAGKVAADFLGRTCQSLTRHESEQLLSAARDNCGVVTPKRLGLVGPDAFPEHSYAKAAGTFKAGAGRGPLSGTIPFVLEAWATDTRERPTVTVCVNRTPITADVLVGRNVNNHATAYGLEGCGLSNPAKNTVTAVEVGRKRDFDFVVNITTPYMPITTDGKEPNLRPVVTELIEVLEKAARRVRRNGSGSVKRTSKKAIILEVLPAAIERNRESGTHRSSSYSLRQLYYSVRTPYIQTTGEELNWGYFCQVVTEYEAELSHDLPGMYRDDRGVLYHPHLRQTIPLGTRSVENYKRPEWTFNKILYCEKEGFFPILIDAEWPESNDCALLTSKGFASRAARDVLDLLTDGEEEITIFCIHDGDGPGTVIYESLNDATKARPARRFRVVNLGLEPEEALAMNLAVERVERKNGKAVAVADYVSPEWREWLQSHRVELNAMDTPTFLRWLGKKFESYSCKVIPPKPVLLNHLTAETKAHIREQLVADAIRAARVDERTEEAVTALRPRLKKTAAGLVAAVKADLDESPAHHWTAPVDRLAAELAGNPPIVTSGEGQP